MISPTPQPPGSGPNGTAHSLDPVASVLNDAIFNLWNVVERITSLPRARHSRYTVTIFGSARLKAEHPLYEEVRWLAEQLTIAGCDIVTGGGPGLMEAANAGAVAADPENRGRSVGVRVELPFEQGANPYIEELYEHQNFFSRLHHFVMASDAFVVMPGGIGTTLEAMMVWQLLQVKKLPAMPLIFVGEMWQEFQEWALRSMCGSEPHLAAPGDLHIPHFVSTVAEVLPLLQPEMACWLDSDLCLRPEVKPDGAV